MATCIFTGTRSKADAELTAKIVKVMVGDNDFYNPINITQYEFNNDYPEEQWVLNVPNYPQDNLITIVDSINQGRN